MHRVHGDSIPLASVFFGPIGAKVDPKCAGDGGRWVKLLADHRMRLASRLRPRATGELLFLTVLKSCRGYG